MKTPLPIPSGIHLRPDNSRVLVRSFLPGDRKGLLRIIERARLLTEKEVGSRLEDLQQHFGNRHVNIERAWQQNYRRVQGHIDDDAAFTKERKLYIGALFSGEYALESAALFNPSIIPDPDQSGLPKGALRFIMSLRATGEGHISSIAFRTGTISADHEINLDAPAIHVSAPELRSDPSFRSSTFFHRLGEMDPDTPWATAFRKSIGPFFTRSQLLEALRSGSNGATPTPRERHRAIKCIKWLAEANYEVHFDPTTAVSERVIFPVAPSESNGMEDARFVLLTDDDGTGTYYATYTAYNGRSILPQLLETSDFINFRASTLNGSSVKNKGMALFPRRIKGRYYMISRQDDENLYLMDSDDLHVWEETHLLRRPMEDWEAVKIGNCGSPIETTEGWLLLTHGVGAMRRYCLGAMLLDLHDPRIVIGHLKEPLIEPDEPLRNGYVPNVVYTCGALIHGDQLILPYGISDTTITIATIDLHDLLSALTASRD